MDGWREWMERGIEALRAGRSPEAADAFQRAADLNPTSIDALLCMALAVWQQHSPGSVSPENDALAAQVEAAFQRALGLDPRNWAGCVLFGRHLANERRFDEARVMFQRALDIEPDNADVWSALGSIRFEEWVAGGKPASAAPEIIREFQRAVSLDQLDDAAMEYIGLVLRETGDRDASARSMEAAADARSESVQRAIANGPQRAFAASGSTAVLTQWAEAILKPPRPPLPPPPPDRRLASAPGTQAVITFNPVQDNSEEKPRPIRVRPEEQACKLVRRVEPVIPGDPISESRLRFVVVIGPERLISHDVMISGNCWLEPFGHHALQQWLYEPTVLDGNAVEVVTEVRLNVRN